MIICRSPLRITIGGGGTDLESYFKTSNGYVISLAIKKYITIILKKSLKKNYEIKYSEYENVDSIGKIKHKIIRECLKKFKISGGIELSSFSDVPFGTGLGSSGSFTVCLLTALYKFTDKKINKNKIIFEAYHIEKKILKQPVGYQDQAIASIGGLLEQFYSKKKIKFQNIILSNKLIKIINNNFLLIFTGSQRKSKKILNIQEKETKRNNKKMIKNLDFTKELGILSKKSINQNFKDYEKILIQHWNYKSKRKGMKLDSKVKKILSFLIKNNFNSYKLVGAGGTGYVLVYTKKIKFLEKILRKKAYTFFRAEVDLQGTRVSTIS